MKVDIMKIKKNQIRIGLTFIIISLLLYSVSICFQNGGSESYETSQLKANLENKLNWEWGTIEVVSTDSTSWSANPSLAVDELGNIHVVWDDATDYGSSGGDNDIFYKQWVTNTLSWTATEVVSTEGTGASSTPTIATDVSGNAHVVWRDTADYDGAGIDYDIFYKTRLSSNSLWITTEEISKFSSDDSESPTIATTSTGDVHILWNDFDPWSGSGVDRDVYYKRWFASNTSWSLSSFISTESSSHSIYPSAAIDSDDNCHAFWSDSTNYDGAEIDYDIFYKYSADTSSTWSLTEVVSTESTSAAFGASIAIDSSDNLHVVWDDSTDYAGSGTDDDIFYKVWISSISSWSSLQVLSTESTEDSRTPSVAVDSSNNVHVVWYDSTDYAGSGTDYDIFYKRWDSSTSSWTSVEVVSEGSTSDSVVPSIDVDSSNNAHIVWMDYTDNFAGSGTDEDIFYRKLQEAPVVPELQTNVFNNLRYLLISGIIALPILVSIIRKRHFI